MAQLTRSSIYDLSSELDKKRIITQYDKDKMYQLVNKFRVRDLLDIRATLIYDTQKSQGMTIAFDAMTRSIRTRVG